MPQPVGSTSPKTAFAAIAASIALPPALRIEIAVYVASGWLVAAIPLVAITSDRLANSRPVILSYPRVRLDVININRIYKNFIIY